VASTFNGGQSEVFIDSNMPSQLGVGNEPRPPFVKHFIVQILAQEGVGLQSRHLSISISRNNKHSLVVLFEQCDDVDRP